MMATSLSASFRGSGLVLVESVQPLVPFSVTSPFPIYLRVWGLCTSSRPTVSEIMLCLAVEKLREGPAWLDNL